MFSNNIKSNIVSPLSEIVPVKLTNIENIPNPTLITSSILQPTVISPMNQSYMDRSIPSFISPKITFYDPLRGIGNPLYNSTDNMYINSNYTDGNLTVNISGKKCDVDKIIKTLRLCSENNQHNRTKLFSLDKQYDPISKYQSNYGSILETESDLSSIRNFLNEYNNENNNKNDKLNKEKSEEWYYVINRTNPYKFLAMKTGSDMKYSGSGVILFESEYLNKITGNIEPTLILVKTYRNIVEDMGGELDKEIVISPSILSDNATKELSEESQHLFLIEKTNPDAKIQDVFPYVDITDIENDSIYRSYLLSVSGTENEDLSSLFKSNREINVNILRKGRAYEETEEIVRFYIKDVKNMIRMSMGGMIQCRDVNGNLWTIRDRTSNCLRRVLMNEYLLNKILKSKIIVEKKVSNHEIFRSKSGIVNFVL